MALDLNKKKYLVLCLMLILLNHHVNGAKDAESQGSQNGTIGAQPLTSRPKGVEPPTNGPKGAEPPTSGPKGVLGPKGAEASTSEPKGAEPPTSEPKGALGRKGVEPPTSGPKGAEPPTSGLKGALEPKGAEPSTSGPKGAKPPTSELKGAEPPTSGPKGALGRKGVEPPTNEPKGALGPKGAEPSTSGPKGAEPPTSDPKGAESLTNGLKSSQPPTSKPKDAEHPTSEPIAAAPQSGSTTPQSQVPQIGTQGVGPPSMPNGNPPLIRIGPNRISDNGTVTGQPQVPCYFIFGDSLVDVGNNNILKTLAKANFDPYGIDFKPVGNTGRFCNGKATVDFLAELLGFDHYIPPSELTNGTDILQGLNFASAAAGIREDTSQHYGDRITMKKQVNNFKNKVGEMAALLGGPQKATDHLGKCLFSVGLGSNDYLNNYFMPNIYPTSKLLTPEQYADDLINQYTTNLMAIYDLGARMFALNGLSQVGCSPNTLANFSPDDTCVKNINDAIELFNTRLKTLVDTLNKDHPDAKFTYINTFGLFQELKDKPSTYGFKVTTDGCCGTGKNKGLVTCLPGQTPCPNRNEYIFFDAYHATEAANLIGARRSYIKQIPTDASPYDIKTLIKQV